MCDGFEPGAIHWLIRNDGVLGLTVFGPGTRKFQHCLWRQAPLPHCPKKLHLAGHRTGLLLNATVPLALARIRVL